MLLDVVEVELYEFATSERCGEADDEEGVIAAPCRTLVTGGDQGLEPVAAAV